MKIGVTERREERSEPFCLKRILVPVEFSDCSLLALRYAVKIATQFEAKLTLLHVIEMHITGSWPFDVARAMAECHTKDASDHLNDWAKSEIPAGILDHLSLLYGAPAHEIVQAAKEENSDLVVLATHCRTGFQHALLGSVAESVVRTAPCAVLAIPVPQPDHDAVEESTRREVTCRS